MPFFTALGAGLLGTSGAIAAGGTAGAAAAATAATVGAAVTGAAAGAAGLGYGIYAGERGAAAQEKAMRQQQQEQQKAATAARSQQRQSEMAMAAANRRQPDIAGIMAGAGEGAAGGPAGTMLTGPTGVDPSQLALGRTSLLGG